MTVQGQRTFPTKRAKGPSALHRDRSEVIAGADKCPKKR